MNRQRKDQTGMTFGYLTVIEPDLSRRYHWHCKCKCGKDVYASTHDLERGKTKSCGCYKREMAHLRVRVKPGDVYGKLTVLQRVENNTDQHSKWDCLCECGNHVFVYGKDLTGCRNRTMCVECAKVAQADKRALDITGQRFGKLTAVRCVGSKRNSRIWECKCDCGQTTFVSAAMLSYGNTRSCGCMRAHSYNEELINDMLFNKHITYSREYSFYDLVSESGKPLRFDFAIFSNNALICLIEYQGEQHYIIANSGFGQYQRDVSDALKRDYCNIHNIPLFEIRFDDNIPKQIDRILYQMNLNTSYANTVPSLGNEEGVTTISQEST